MDHAKRVGECVEALKTAIAAARAAGYRVDIGNLDGGVSETSKVQLAPETMPEQKPEVRKGIGSAPNTPKAVDSA